MYKYQIYVIYRPTALCNSLRDHAVVLRIGPTLPAIRHGCIRHLYMIYMPVFNFLSLCTRHRVGLYVCTCGSRYISCRCQCLSSTHFLPAANYWPLVYIYEQTKVFRERISTDDVKSQTIRSKYSRHGRLTQTI